MPVYLCSPGNHDQHASTSTSTNESYNYGIQVFAQPFPLTEDDLQYHWDQFRCGHTTDLVAAATVPTRRYTATATATATTRLPPLPPRTSHHNDDDGNNDHHDDHHAPTATTTTTATTPPPLRRIRHSEVVVVDDVCIAHDRLWLRLRWPGHVKALPPPPSSQQQQQQLSHTALFAGYIAMGSTNRNDSHDSGSNSSHHTNTTITTFSSSNPLLVPAAAAAAAAATNEAEDHVLQGSLPSANEEAPTTVTDDATTSPRLICRRTGLIYPSSPMLQLLHTYDDGISSMTLLPFLLSSTNSDTVFCRICREGLYGDENDELPTAAADTDDTPVRPVVPMASTRPSRRGRAATAATTLTTTAATELRRRSPRLHPPVHTSNAADAIIRNQPMDVVVDDDDDEEEENLFLDTEENDDDVGLQYPPMFDDGDKVEEIVTTAGSMASSGTTSFVAPQYNGPITPVPHYSPNTEALQNPMLKPCECSGSMAFVHYLCIEQWRCRSRHPNALNGLNCETCNKPYSLPPPTERRTPHHHNMEGMLVQDENGRLVFPNNMIDNNDWLDAMPPHVMQALRRPHVWWQIGAYIVRKRYLRPLVPVIMSPIVALYCRARRLLKKRGVARRRWACSLCRRRARWKCVRCLRSYYCSRQCQNVSWHIIHKHVCYKPSRFWSSIVFYGLLTLFLLPGIVRDPLMYDIIVCIIPLSFIIMGILGGGIATVIKKSVGYDIRGRMMEFLVVLATIWFSMITWGLVQAFFSLPRQTCYGTLGAFNVTHVDLFPSLHTSNATIDDTPDMVDASTWTFAATGRALVSTIRSLLILNLRMIHFCILLPAQMVYKIWDRIFLHSRLRPIVCTRGNSHLTVANNTTMRLGYDSGFVTRTLRVLWNWKDRERNSTDAVATTTGMLDSLRDRDDTDLLASTTVDGTVNQTSSSIGCFEHISNANANFILSVWDDPGSSEHDWMNHHRGQCASDLLLVLTLYCMAMITLVGSILYKQHERRQRQQVNNPHHPGRVHHIHARQRHRPIFELRRNQRHEHQA